MESAEFNYCGYWYCCHYSGFSKFLLYQLFWNRWFLLLYSQITETLFSDSTILACPAVHIKSHWDTTYKTNQHNFLPVFSVNSTYCYSPACFLLRFQTVSDFAPFSHWVCNIRFYFPFPGQTAGIRVFQNIQNKRI